MSISLREILLEVSREMAAKYDQLLSLIPQSQQRGEGREEVLREFLRLYLPERFGVSTGFVFDSSGSVSRQVDIIIYDREFSPKLSLGEKYIYPVECVVGVGEVKSNIDSTDILNNAIENIRSVKSLKRMGQARLGGGYVGGKLDNLSDRHSQICGFIFGSKLMSKKSMMETLMDYCKQNNSQRHIWVDLLGSLHDGIYYYWKPDNNGRTQDSHPMDALGIYHKQPKEGLASLLSFYMILYTQLSSKIAGVPDIVHYLQETDAHDSIFTKIQGSVT